MLLGLTANVAPLLIKPQISTTSAWTGEEVIRFGASFLSPDDGVNTNFQCPGGTAHPAPLKAISVISSFIPGLRADNK